jgi:hypothetical protein
MAGDSRKDFILSAIGEHIPTIKKSKIRVSSPVIAGAEMKKR